MNDIYQTIDQFVGEMKLFMCFGMETGGLTFLVFRVSVSSTDSG